MEEQLSLGLSYVCYMFTAPPAGKQFVTLPKAVTLSAVSIAKGKFSFGSADSADTSHIIITAVSSKYIPLPDALLSVLLSPYVILHQINGVDCNCK